MDLTGIGVLLIGIAFLVLAIFLARVLNHTASILGGIDRTVEQLPAQLDGILNETGNLIHNSNNTLADVNEKLGTLTPLFQIVGDVGETTRAVSSSLVNATASMKTKGNPNEELQNKRLGGVYGSVALAYYAMRKKNELTKVKPTSKRSTLYTEGEQRSFDIQRMQAEAKEAARNGL